MNNDRRIELEARERELVEGEKERFRERIHTALLPFREMKLRPEEADSWQPILRERVKAFFFSEYKQFVSVAFDAEDANAMIVRALNRPRRVRVAINLEAQH
jgi:hypothetical protein